MTDFGTDISCVTDLADDGRSVTGRMVVAEAIARRLITPRGRLIDDPDYGFDLTAYLNDDLTPTELGALRSGAEQECLKDERVEQAEIEAVLDSAGLLTVNIDLTVADGPFALVLAVSATSVTIISVTP
jgi:phage baseplate assembly protein W